MAKTITAKILIMSSTGTRVLLVLASLVIVIAGLKAASTIIVPLLMALFIAIITTPFMPVSYTHLTLPTTPYV